MGQQVGETIPLIDNLLWQLFLVLYIVYVYICRVGEVLSDGSCMYAISQGAMAVECRSFDLETLDMLSPLTHRESLLQCLAERAMLRTLEGGCSVPIAVVSQVGSHANLFAVRSCVFVSILSNFMLWSCPPYSGVFLLYRKYHCTGWKNITVLSVIEITVLVLVHMFCSLISTLGE